MEGCLPLGALPDVDFPVTSFCLKKDDHLVFLSDGVVEAQSRTGALFGFDRLQQLLQHPRSAAELGEAAQRFGQEDDISVVSILCLSGAPALSSA